MLGNPILLRLFVLAIPATLMVPSIMAEAENPPPGYTRYPVPLNPAIESSVFLTMIDLHAVQYVSATVCGGVDPERIRNGGGILLFEAESHATTRTELKPIASHFFLLGEVDEWGYAMSATYPDQVHIEVREGRTLEAGPRWVCIVLKLFNLDDTLSGRFLIALVNDGGGAEREAWISVAGGLAKPAATFNWNGTGSILHFARLEFDSGPMVSASVRAPTSQNLRVDSGGRAHFQASGDVLGGIGLPLEGFGTSLVTLHTPDGRTLISCPDLRICFRSEALRAQTASVFSGPGGSYRVVHEGTATIDSPGAMLLAIETTLPTGVRTV